MIPSAETHLDWLEISADYRCNNRCVGCFSVQDSGDAMSTEEVYENLYLGKRRGARYLWLGGGDPTLRKDLFAILHKARLLGYERIRIETNAMLLAYPEYTRRAVQAGLTEVSVSIKGHTAELHDRLTQTPGCFALLMRGIAEVRKYGLPVEGDVLLYRSTVAALPEMVSHFSAAGVRRFNVWLLSSAGQPQHGAEVPYLSEVGPALAAALEHLPPDAPEDWLTSLHTPPCILPPGLERCRFYAPDLKLLVANPGGFRFMLEESPIEGGQYLPGCAECGLRQRCGGIRTEYLDLYGPAEFRPLPPQP